MKAHSTNPQHSRTRPGSPRRATTDRRWSPELERKLRRVGLFLCDVDGVLTDATVLLGDGAECKRFDVRDGFGLRLLQRQGIKVGWISHRPSLATTRRAEELQINYLHQAQGSKLAAAESMIARAGLGWAQTCYMGDDIVDLAVLRRVGLAVTVPGAISEAKAMADYVTQAAGGDGAVREVAEMILKAQNRWAELVALYSE